MQRPELLLKPSVIFFDVPLTGQFPAVFIFGLAGKILNFPVFTRQSR